MNSSQVWLLLAPSPPLLVMPAPEGPVTIELVSRSIDLVDLIHRVVENRCAVPVGNDEWKGSKKSLNKILKKYGSTEKLKEQFGFSAQSLNWHILFRHAGGEVSLQPWVNVDYWLIHAEVDKLRSSKKALLDPEQVVETVAVSALAEIIAGQANADLNSSLIQACEYWPNSQQAAFQTLTEKSDRVVSAFVTHLTDGDEKQPAVIPKLEIGEFPSWFVWSPTAINDLKDRHERIIEMILASRPIPENQNYCSYQGTSAWLSFADVTLNPHEAASVARVNDAAKEIGQRVSEETNLDFLSLGPGDGVKDSTVLEEVQKTVEDLHYFPVDISPLMLGVAIGQIKKKIQNLKVTGVVTDFNKKTLRAKDLVLQNSPGRKTLINMLGNTIGNIEQDWKFLCSLGNSMDPGDYLLLETRTTNCLEHTLEVEAQKRPERVKFFFEPLAAIGATYDIDDLYSAIDKELNGTSVKMYCRNVKHGRFSSRTVELFKFKHYDENYYERVSEQINAEILFRNGPDQPNTEIALFRKK